MKQVRIHSAAPALPAIRQNMRQTLGKWGSCASRKGWRSLFSGWKGSAPQQRLCAARRHESPGRCDVTLMLVAGASSLLIIDRLFGWLIYGFVIVLIIGSSG
ncbi:hypothetical protein TcCL_Unassigned03313 [Trypanosoma cruzi]|nr:hypothetical protein TcCL_Unassigned03313 [Trypanosoma cruzi]